MEGAEAVANLTLIAEGIFIKLLLSGEENVKG